VGQKIHPEGLRLGYIRDWDAKWFNLRQMPDLLEEDRQIRRYLKRKLAGASVSRVCIERAGKNLRVNIYTARPGIVIGKKGADIENLRKDISDITSRKMNEVALNVMEIKRPELDAQLVSEGIAAQLEKSVGFRRVMKKTIERTMQAGALGIKVRVSGRLGGAEIARVEWMKEGRVPLQTFRADIHYGFSEAHITMGRIGCKVWIFKKELFKKTREDLMEEAKLIPKEQIEQIAAVEAVKAPEPVAAVRAADDDLIPEEGQ
jgi:small subunit ribosomal protein S3